VPSTPPETVGFAHNCLPHGRHKAVLLCAGRRMHARGVHMQMQVTLVVRNHLDLLCMLSADSTERPHIQSALGPCALPSMYSPHGSTGTAYTLYKQQPAA
jgi:hypothetical protein